MQTRRIVFAIVLLIVTIAAILRLRGIESWSLNNDEIAEVRWASQPFGDMLEEVRNDLVHPPVDYILQHAMWRAGASETARRLPSVVFGTASVALLMLLGRFWFSATAGLAAGFFLAVAPIHIRYSQEVRPYASGVFLVLLALVFLEMYARRKSRTTAVLWFSAVLLAGWTLYFAGMVAGVVSLARIFLDRRDDMKVLWRRMPLILAGWVVLYAPWLLIVARAVKRTPVVAREHLTRDWWLFRLHAFAAGDQDYHPITIGSWLFWFAVLLGLLLSIRYRLLRTATIWFLGCGSLSILVLQLRPHYPSPRYLMPAFVGAFLLAGAAVGWMWSIRALRGAAIVLPAVFCAYAWLTLSSYFEGARSNWRGVSEFVHERARPGDTVVLTNPWVTRNFGFYWLSMPKRPEVRVERFVARAGELEGPAWIVTGQCRQADPIFAAGLMAEWPETERATVRYLRAGQRLPTADELCPE